MGAVWRKQDQQGCKTEHCRWSCIQDPHPLFPNAGKCQTQCSESLCTVWFWLLHYYKKWTILQQLKSWWSVWNLCLSSTCHKTSLFSLLLHFRSTLNVTQSQLNGYPANLLLSSSLAHASQTAAARISKENSGLFKHPTQKHTHGLQASGVKKKSGYIHT